MKKIIVVFAAFIFMQNQAMNTIQDNASKKISFYIKTPSYQFFKNDRWKKLQTFYNEGKLREDFYVIEAEEENDDSNSLKIIAPKYHKRSWPSVDKIFLNIKCDGPSRTISPAEYRNIVHKNYTPKFIELLVSKDFKPSSKKGVKAWLGDYTTWKSEKKK